MCWSSVCENGRALAATELRHAGIAVDIGRDGSLQSTKAAVINTAFQLPVDTSMMGFAVAAVNGSQRQRFSRRAARSESSAQRGLQAGENSSMQLLISSRGATSQRHAHF